MRDRIVPRLRGVEARSGRLVALGAPIDGIDELLRLADRPHCVDEGAVEVEASVRSWGWGRPPLVLHLVKQSSLWDLVEPFQVNLHLEEELSSLWHI